MIRFNDRSYLVEFYEIHLWNDHYDTEPYWEALQRPDSAATRFSASEIDEAWKTAKRTYKGSRLRRVKYTPELENTNPILVSITKREATR